MVLDLQQGDQFAPDYLRFNGQTDATYPGDDRYAPFWERVSDLQVPVCIHPNNPRNRRTDRRDGD